jgi:quinol monooxygenase YgiN
VHAVYRQTTLNAQSEEGTIYYCISRDGNDPSIFHFFERYASRKAFEGHNEQDAVRGLVASGWIRDVKAVFAKAIGSPSE